MFLRDSDRSMTVIISVMYCDKVTPMCYECYTRRQNGTLLMKFLMFLRDSDRNMTVIISVMYCDVLEGGFNDIIVPLRTLRIKCFCVFLL